MKYILLLFIVCSVNGATPDLNPTHYVVQVQVEPKVVVAPVATISKVPMAVNLVWIPSISEDVAYYNLYYGYGERDFIDRLTCYGNSTTLSNLVGWQPLYICVTAEGVNGGESDYSETTIYTPAMLFDIYFPQTLFDVQLESSYDRVNWTNCPSVIVNSKWRVAPDRQINQQFYRTKSL